jgi:tetratricopeptide (TPR) repeat protein
VRRSDLLSAAALSTALLLSSCSAVRPALEVWRGNTLFRKGQDSLALLRYFRALDRPAGETWDSWIRYNIGSSYVSLGELGPGTRVLDGVMEDVTAQLGPEDASRGPRSRWYRELEFRARFNRAAAAYERGAYVEAARGFVAALRVRPDSWDTKVNLELSLAEQASRPAAGAQRPASQEKAEVRPESRKLLEQIEKEEKPAWLSSRERQEYAEDW